MGKSIVSKGKTVKEAVNIAIDLLGVTNSGVDIEVLEPESKGIFGIGSKHAVVRVTVKQTEMMETVPQEQMVAAEDLENIIEAINTLEIKADEEFIAAVSTELPQGELEGKAWVAEGHIFCKEGPNKYPLVSPAKGIKLYKNHELIETTVVVSEEDYLHVELQDEERIPSWELTLNGDRMEAHLKVVPGLSIYRRLKDTPPAPFIQLEVDEKVVPIFIDSDLIVNELKTLGIVHGLDYREIANACTTEAAGTFVIAKGTPFKPGKNGSFLPVKEVSIKKGMRERADGTVDYREIQEFPSVERGQILGVVQPPIPGTDGQTVTNEPVSPPEVFPLTVQAGRGVILVEDGTKVVAVENGQPDIKIKGTLAKVSVIPKLVIPTDVNLQCGNVRYIGDVEVLGTVQDGMLVEAQGNIVVQGNTFQSKVTAYKSVIIHKNVIGSEITSGKGSLLEQELAPLVSEIYKLLGQMRLAMQQIMNVSAFKITTISRTGLGPLLKILCDGKFKSIPPLIQGLNKQLKSGADSLDKDWLQLGAKLYKTFITPQFAEMYSLEEWDALYKQVETLYTSICLDVDQEDCFIKASYLQNSELYSTGSIQIVGEGVYNSKLYAKGTLQIDGYVRGGEIYAGKGAKIREAGTKGGLPTKIQVPRDQSIYINLALEDTVILIGNVSHTFTRETNFVRARLDENDKLIIN